MTLSPDTTEHAAVVALVAELDAAASALNVDRFLDLYVDGPDFAFVFNGTMRTTLAEARASTKPRGRTYGRPRSGLKSGTLHFQHRA